MHISDNFRHGIADYLILLEKKYPEKAIHELVSTRYALNHFERSILYRGVTSSEKAIKRREKLITIEQLNNRTLHIDLFNVLFTIAAYLRGFPVYIAMDGLVRDASESHDSHEWVEHLEKALDLLMKQFDKLGASSISIYLDNPLHMSGYLAKEIEKRQEFVKTSIEIMTVDSPDHYIMNATDGVVCTSDSGIIDRISLPVFDLPGYVLNEKFSARLMRLEELG